MEPHSDDEQQKMLMAQIVQEQMAEIEHQLSQIEAKKVELAAKRMERQLLSVDKNQLIQAILNLLQNALDASSPGSTITLSGERIPPDYLIIISDRGSGMTADTLKRIFDLYFTTKADGTGMGLPLVAQIVQSHGGTIDVESNFGEGTRFSIRLPLEEIA